MEEEGLEAVGVGRPELVPATTRHPDHHRHPRLPVEHVGDRGGVVDDLVERQQGEVDRHQLDDRSQPPHRRADADADDRVLGDRRVADAPLTELVEQPFGHLERALEAADVLAHHEDRLVAAHLLGHRVAQRLSHPQRRHQASSSSAAISGSTPSPASPSTAGLGRGPCGCPA